MVENCSNVRNFYIHTLIYTYMFNFSFRWREIKKIKKLLEMVGIVPEWLM